MSTQNSPTDNEKNLSSKQLQAVALLAQGNTIEHAARVVGVNEKTIDNWKKLPPFQAALHQVEDDLYSDSLKLLKKSAKAAIVTLIGCMESKTTPYVRVQAASKLLELGMELHKLQELQLLETEIAALKAMLEEHDRTTERVRRR